MKVFFFFLSVTPPKFFFELPTELLKNTFVGFVLPNKNNEDCFFETIIDELKEEQKKVEERKEKERSFQQIFEAVKVKLKDKVDIESLDDFGETPIYLFNKKGRKQKSKFFIFNN
jgi:hypothetical protein